METPHIAQMRHFVSNGTFDFSSKTNNATTPLEGKKAHPFSAKGYCCDPVDMAYMDKIWKKPKKIVA